MKILTGSLIIIITAFGSLNIKAENLKMAKSGNCFSEANLFKVHNWIETQIKKSNRTFIEYDGYELYTEPDMVIILKEKGYTLARITRENGICSLAILKSSNDLIVKRAGQIFCAILKTEEVNKTDR